jgi:hypothetical protein
VSLDVVFLEIRSAHRAQIVRKAEEKRRPDEALERNRIHSLTIVEEVTRGIRVGACM